MSHFRESLKMSQQLLKDLDEFNATFPATQEFLQKKSKETGREITHHSQLTLEEKDELFRYLYNLRNKLDCNKLN